MSSPSSVGVLGEIMTGFFAQVGISRWVLVRVVQRWPDFIFADQDRVYSFVESKGFTIGNENGTGLQSRVVDSEMREGMWRTVRQLNSDPFLKVWHAGQMGVSEAGVESLAASVLVPIRASATFRRCRWPHNCQGDIWAMARGTRLDPQSGHCVPVRVRTPPCLPRPAATLRG